MQVLGTKKVKLERNLGSLPASLTLKLAVLHQLGIIDQLLFVHSQAQTTRMLGYLLNENGATGSATIRRMVAYYAEEGRLLGDDRQQEVNDLLKRLL